MSICFIDKKTGSVYKPASIKAPAKHERYNLNIIESREECFKENFKVGQITTFGCEFDPYDGNFLFYLFF